MIFSITQVYWLAGLIMACAAVFNFLDATNPKRWTTGLFWGCTPSCSCWATRCRRKWWA